MMTQSWLWDSQIADDKKMVTLFLKHFLQLNAQNIKAIIFPSKKEFT